MSTETSPDYYELQVLHDHNYIRFTYDDDQFEGGFWGLKIFLGQFKPEHPVVLKLDSEFGDSYSEILPTDLHVYYVISGKLAQSLAKEEITGFSTFPVTTPEGIGDYVGISIHGRTDGIIGKPLEHIQLVAGTQNADIMLVNDRGMTVGRTIINEKAFSVLSKFELPNVEFNPINKIAQT